ncbi:MAG: hypothetical protein HY429_00760 [Candidatus Levybacteria bacterium]|nr:hypothetical protein [Candidatus Levybacteria bacterium]
MIRRVALFIGVLTAVWAFLLYNTRYTDESRFFDTVLKPCEAVGKLNDQSVYIDCSVAGFKEGDRIENLFVLALALSLGSFVVAFLPRKKHTSNHI